MTPSGSVRYHALGLELDRRVLEDVRAKHELDLRQQRRVRAVGARVVVEMKNAVLVLPELARVTNVLAVAGNEHVLREPVVPLLALFVEEDLADEDLVAADDVVVLHVGLDAVSERFSVEIAERL